MADVLVRIGELNHLTGGAVSCDTSFHAVQCLAIHLSIEGKPVVKSALESTTCTQLLCFATVITVLYAYTELELETEGKGEGFLGQGRACKTKAVWETI